MRYRLLGPLEVVGEDGTTVVLGGEKERTLLAGLALGANRVVSTSFLVNALWGESPPKHAANALQVQVSRLRKKLATASGGGEVLSREGAGYLLAVGPGQVDVTRFEELVASPPGSPGEVAVRLAEALGLWRGPALADMDSDVLRAEGVRLNELRLMALERRFDADLELGRHVGVVPELEAVVAAVPLREGFTRQLMIALYRSGRQADALAVYRRTRQILGDELGIDPSPGLQALELAVLNQSSDLNSPVGLLAEDSAPTLPSGTVTFLFTNMEGSTRLLTELGGERYAAELMNHRGVIREALAANRGIQPGAEGDASFLAFARASDALAAAQEIHKGLRGGTVQVRIGVHTGEPLIVNGDYVGLDVHRAARICSAAHGGQVLVSQSTRDLTGGEFTDLGEFRLKDLSAPERLYQVGTEEFPPPRALGTGNLPLQPTPLLGRRRELADLLGLVRGNRLVTLTGPGGTGKTRLALQVAAEMADDYRDGVWWVPLAAISDPNLVVPSVAQALGTAESDPAQYLSDRHLLILADNLEQVLDASPQLGALLGAAPGVSLLVTSRERLGISGEQEYPVAPLDHATAAELFATRARQAKPDFAPDERVGEICDRLDRLPLAIELASTRVKLMTTDQILARLEQRFELLKGSRRDTPNRQSTMKAAIDWSYDLLSEEQRRVFRGLAVFVGTFELDAAETVCSTDIDALQSLVDKSLIEPAENGRVFMLETTRDYARIRLQDNDELADLQFRHAQWFFQEAKAIRRDMDSYGGLTGLPQGPTAHRLRADTDNFRAALAWSLEHDLSDGIELAITLYRPWIHRGQQTRDRRLVRASIG